MITVSWLEVIPHWYTLMIWLDQITYAIPIGKYRTTSTRKQANYKLLKELGTTDRNKNSNVFQKKEREFVNKDNVLTLSWHHSQVKVIVIRKIDKYYVKTTLNKGNDKGIRSVGMSFQAKSFAQMQSVCVFKIESRSLVWSIS